MPIDHLVETGHGRRHAVQDLAQNLHSNETIKDVFIITASVSSICTFPKIDFLFSCFRTFENYLHFPGVFRLIYDLSFCDLSRFYWIFSISRTFYKYVQYLNSHGFCDFCLPLIYLDFQEMSEFLYNSTPVTFFLPLVYQYLSWFMPNWNKDEFSSNFIKNENWQLSN
jgi:hypothetical protein